MDTTGSADATPTSRGLAVGERVFGRYVLQRQLGQGGMGTVWLARDEKLECEVALKFLADRLRWDEAALASLKEETRRARLLSHPGIVRIHDLADEGGYTAISMEFLSGGSLHAVRARRSPAVFGPAEIMVWLPGLCAALDHAHVCGVIHRDLKPSNLLLDADGSVKIADFGIAQPLAETALRLSQWAPSGTLAYMSPQQHFGEAPSRADDIYSLGATLYELLTGKPPFHSGNLAAQIERRRPDALGERRRQLGAGDLSPVPAEWEAVVAACLAKRPEERPGSAGEVAAQLVRPRRASCPARAREVVLGSYRRVPPRTRALLLAAAGLAMGAAFVWSRPLAAPQTAQSAVVVAPAFPSDATRAWSAWNLDGDGRDATGQGRALELQRAVPCADRFGRIDRALFFNGNAVAQCANLPTAGWTADAPFSVALWVKPARWADTGGTLVTLHSELQDDFFWALAVHGDRAHFTLGRMQVVAPDEVLGSAALPPDRWAHLAATSDGRTMRLFVSGRLVGEAPIRQARGAAVRGAPTLLLAHNHRFDGEKFNGALDELRLWRRALAATEIAQLAEPEPPPRLVPTQGVYSGKDDLAAAVTREFGPLTEIADWRDLQRWHGDDTAEWCDRYNLAVQSAGPLLQRDGQRFSKGARQYFLNRFDGKRPEYFLAHEEMGGMVLALGSWFDVTQRVLAKLPFAAPRREILHADSGASIQHDLGEDAQRTALVLEYNAQMRADGAAAVVELRLRDGRVFGAECAPAGDGLFSVALGERGRPGRTRQLAATYGALHFAVVARGERLFFRAVAEVGAAVVFQEELPVDFTAREVAQVTVRGVDSAELTAEE